MTIYNFSDKPFPPWPDSTKSHPGFFFLFFSFFFLFFFLFFFFFFSFFSFFFRFVFVFLQKIIFSFPSLSPFLLFSLQAGKGGLTPHGAKVLANWGKWFQVQINDHYKLNLDDCSNAYYMGYSYTDVSHRCQGFFFSFPSLSSSSSLFFLTTVEFPDTLHLLLLLSAFTPPLSSLLSALCSPFSPFLFSR